MLNQKAEDQVKEKEDLLNQQLQLSDQFQASLDKKKEEYVIFLKY